MQPLVIEYRLEGPHRGYQFVTPTESLDDETLRTIWRNAMPRGYGWGTVQFTGATTLKCFPANLRQIALSEVTVTDQQDEHGRRGIRRAVITLLSLQDAVAVLRKRVEQFLIEQRTDVRAKPSVIQWRKQADKVTGKVRGKTQTVMLSTYDPRGWKAVEALVIQSATANGSIIPFTTLALDHREELHVVAMPAEYGRAIRDVPTLPLRFS